MLPEDDLWLYAPQNGLFQGNPVLTRYGTIFCLQWIDRISVILPKTKSLYLYNCFVNILFKWRLVKQVIFVGLNHGGFNDTSTVCALILHSTPCPPLSLFMFSELYSPWVYSPCIDPVFLTYAYNLFHYWISMCVVFPWGNYAWSHTKNMLVWKKLDDMDRGRAAQSNTV